MLMSSSRCRCSLGASSERELAHARWAIGVVPQACFASSRSTKDRFSLIVPAIAAQPLFGRSPIQAQGSVFWPWWRRARSSPPSLTALWGLLDADMDRGRQVPDHDAAGHADTTRQRFGHICASDWLLYAGTVGLCRRWRCHCRRVLTRICAVYLRAEARLPQRQPPAPLAFVGSSRSMTWASKWGVPAHSYTTDSDSCPVART